MYEGFPGEEKTFFVRRFMLPNEEVFSSTLVHGAVGPRGVFFALRRRPPLGDSRFLLLFGSSPPRSRFLVIWVFVVFLPPLGHPESGQAFGW